MSPNSFIRRLHRDLAAKNAAKARVKRRVFERIEAGPAAEPLAQVRRALQPSRTRKQLLWERVQARLAAPTSATVLQKIHAILSPKAAMQLRVKEGVLQHLQPATRTRTPFWPQGALRLTAAFAVLALAVRLSPALFVATPTVAESNVSALPTRGEVQVSVGGLWQPVDAEITVQPGMKLRTQDGEASILFHDDGVVRLDANTTIEIHDVSDRSEPVTAGAATTFTLFTGRVWVQGLVSSNVRGFTVGTSYGDVTVNEGSVSIAEDQVVDVLVYNRRATVHHNANDIVLVSGDRTQMWEGNVPLVKKISDARYAAVWARQNLDRDAVHRREIAQLQQERRAARAGILPTSHFYPVKRAAETVDVLLTFDDEERAQKRINQAQRRLDEAAALIGEHQEQDAQAHLAEYRDMLQELANETDSSVVDYLLQQMLAETSADVAAVQPGDEAYLLKLAVLEASTAFNKERSAEELEAVLLMDALASARRLLEQGELEQVRTEWNKLQPSLSVLQTDALPNDVRKEATASLARFAVLAEQNRSQLAEIDADAMEQIARHLPAEPPQEENRVANVSEEELQSIVQDIRERIFVYDMTRSRLNQLIVELKALSGHPEEGRILRRLYTELPNGPENFPDRIKKEITRLRWETAAEL